MRTATALFWIALLVLAAAFGLQAIGWLLAAVLALGLALVLAALFLAWLVRRRLRRAWRRWSRVAGAGGEHPGRTPRGNGEVIDVEAKVRDPPGPPR